MYRHVHIRNPVALRNLDERISNIFKARGLDAWRWVRTLFVDLNQDRNKIITVLTRTVNLIEADIQTLASAELLVTLRERCPSLRLLKVLVDPDSREEMMQMGFFEHVKHLGIMTLRRTSNQKQPMDPSTDVLPWNMPAVTHFVWHDRVFKPLHETAFLSRCRFPHLTHLDIQLACRHAALDGIPHLCRLLDAHRNLRSLRMLVKAEWHLTIVPFVRARNLRIRCGYRCPPPALVPLLRPEVKTLELEFTRFIWERCEREITVSLCDLLTQFTAENDTRPTLEAIRLSAGDVVGKPKPRDPEDGKFLLCTLRSHVLALNARGIRIFVDDNQICI
jgi:hypothetical protein